MKNLRILCIISAVFVVAEIICLFFPVIHIPRPETTWTDFIYSDYYKNIIDMGFGRNGSVEKIVPLMIQLIIPPATALLLRGSLSDPSIGWRIVNFFSGLSFLVVVAISAAVLTFTFWGPEILLTGASIIVMAFSSFCGFTMIISAFLLQAISGKR